MGYDNRPNLNCKQFDQNGTDYLYLAGHNCVCGTGGTISSNSGYQISGATILKTGVQLNTLLLGCNNVAGNASLAIGTSVNANGSTSIAIGSSSCSMGNKSIVIGNGSKSICDCATTIGYNNVSCAVNASIFGGNNNTICSGNTNTTLIGGTSITLASSTFANYVAIPNLAILCTPAGGGNYLCWNSTTKRVGVTTSTSVGWSSTGNTSTVVGCGTIISGSTYSGNTIYGVCAGKGITTGSNNTIIGTNAAYSNVTGSSNVILGSCSGYNETTSNKLYIANSANKSLIYGEFDNEKLCVRGKTYISGLTNASKSNIVFYDTSTKELSYGTAPITGEVNTASNLGSGYCIFTTKSGVNFPFKSLCAGTGIAMSCTANDITICNSAAQGEVNTASNLGSGYCIFTTKSGVNFPFKSLLAGTGIAMSCTANDITICSTGEANTASNLGSGYQIFTSKSGINLPFKSLLAGTAINITCTTTDITINSTAEANTASNLGSGTGVYASKSGVDLRFKSLLAGTGTIITNTANDITICGTGEANTASNLGTGYCIFTSKSGVNFPFKSLKFCSTITQAEINTASYLGSGVGIYASKSGVDLRFKSLSAGTNITITTGSTKITINSTGGGHTIKNNAGTALSPETYLTFKTNGIGTEIAADNAGATSTDISPRLNSLVDVDPTGIADGDVWSYDVAGSKTVPQPTVPYTDILRSVEANISTDKILSTYLPAGYQIDTIIIIETSGNAAGDITISSTSGGTDIVNAQTVGASADVKAVLVNTNGVYFSSVNDTDMYVSSSSWGSGVVSIYFTMEKII